VKKRLALNLSLLYNKAMKKCQECGKVKSINNFYKSQKTYCKECHKKRTVIWQKSHPQIVKEIDIKQRANPKHRKRQAEYYREWYAKHGRQRTRQDRELIALWRKLNPEKCKVRNLVGHALKLGKIIKPKYCSKCGEKRKLVAHHDDYKFPLKIRWLCYSCHQLYHNGKY